MMGAYGSSCSARVVQLVFKAAPLQLEPPILLFVLVQMRNAPVNRASLAVLEQG